MIATRRGGQTLSVGDDVTTDFHRTCIGKVFTVVEIVEYNACESGCMVLVCLKGNPDRLLNGTSGLGLDTNWFKKVEK